MKNILLKISSFAIVLLLLVGVNSCVKDDFDTPPTQNIPVGDILTVRDLVASATSSPQRVTEDKSLFGVISMGEQNGNLYKAAYMQDVTGGIKLSLLSSTSLAVGDSIRIYLNGTRFYSDNGQVMIDSIEITNNIIKISAGNTIEPVEITLADLNTGSFVGQLVKINNVQFKNSELGKTYADAEALSTENRRIEDCTTSESDVRTSGYANFAGDILPEGRGSIIAIASVFNNSQLYIRDVNEVVMTGERCGDIPGGEPVEPVDVVDEEFNSISDGSDVSISGWTNVLVAGDRLWQGKTFSVDKYIQASGHLSGLTEMETWLITPPVTNISTKVLSFKTGMAYWEHTTGAPLTVLISTDFVGDNFATATWEELDVDLADENSSNYGWSETGEVDLSNYSGNGAIAFKYVGSDTESTSSLIDDVLIDLPGSGGGGGGGTVTPVDEINETFESAVNYEDIVIEGWTNMLVQGDRKWQGKTFETDKYVQASAYNSGLEAMETWLITPPVTNISDKVLSFKSGMAYWEHTSGTPMTILISTDFVGDNFETATWDELNATLAGSGEVNYAWVESGEIDLSAYSGNAAIAFKYVGSGTESTSIQIDDVLITDGSGGGGGGSVTPVDAIDEQFNSIVNYDDISLTDWTNINVVGDRKWQGKIFDADKYAQATAYGDGGPVQMETWLITPPVTNIGSKTLSLKTAKAYWVHTSGNPMTVWVSEDFNGDNFETATWIEINPTIAVESDTDHAWIDSGDYALSAFSGDAAIAFKYVGSSTETTSFRLDDILVQ